MATVKTLELVENLTVEDTVLFLLSGGGSSATARIAGPDSPLPGGKSRSKRYAACSDSILSHRPDGGLLHGHLPEGGQLLSLGDEVQLLHRLQGVQ